jgi:hypothetical protein
MSWEEIMLSSRRFTTGQILAELTVFSRLQPGPPAGWSAASSAGMHAPTLAPGSALRPTVRLEQDWLTGPIAAACAGCGTAGVAAVLDAGSRR